MTALFSYPRIFPFLYLDARASSFFDDVYNLLFDFPFPFPVYNSFFPRCFYYVSNFLFLYFGFVDRSIA